MTISIVTPWLGHPELIPDYEATVTGAEVIIVDNASDEATASALRAMVDRLGGKYIRNEVNAYFCAANNQGLAVATGEVVVFLNSDVRGGNGWLSHVERDVARATLVGPSVQLFEVDHEAYPYVEGWCCSARREVWDKLGGWDAETFGYCYADDVDLSFRARLAGFRLLRSHWKIEHIGNATNATLPGAYDHAEENREKVRQRIRAWRRAAA